MPKAEILPLLIIFAQLIDRSSSGLVHGPPKLTSKSTSEIWFHIPSTGAPTKLSLFCQALGNPEIFYWTKNGHPFNVDGERVIWERPGVSGTIAFLRPSIHDQGYYQCFVQNIFGTAVSRQFHVQLGVLDHFPRTEPRTVTAIEGQSLTIRCSKPYGVPEPRIFWLYRDSKKSTVMQTIRRRHIVVDGDGNLQFIFTKLHDSRSNLIYQCAATSPVLQGEYRAGDQVQLIVQQASDPPQSVPARILWVSPDIVVVKAGERLKLTCIFGGYPEPLIVWHKVDWELTKVRMKNLNSSESDFGKSLIIEPVLPQDEGIYECASQGIFHRMTVQVSAAPYWEEKPPENIDQAEETTAELRCKSSGVPKPLIRWFLNGKSFDELSENPRRLVLDKGRLLRIVDLNHDVDTGVYQCNASNPLGYIFANAFVNVRAHAPRFISPIKRIFNVVAKTTVDISCEVVAAPKAFIQWVDLRDRPIRTVPGKVQILPNNTLRILDVHFGDDGIYYCNVTNKYGLNRATNILTVYNPTYFVEIPEPSKRIIEANESIDLKCEAKCDKRLHIDYRWLRYGELIDMADRNYILVKPNHLKIVNARGKHSGFFNCVAETPVDRRKSGIQLIVRDVPERPTVTRVDCNERRAMIRWERTFDNYDPLIQYVVELETGFEKDVWRVVLSEQTVDKDVYEADVTLTPWVNYTFRVFGVNSHGHGPAGQKKGPGATPGRSSFPYKNPTNVMAAGTNPHNLVIYWKPFEKEDWNSPKLMYLIRYRLNEDGIDWEEFIVEDSLANHTIIRDQPTFREYSIQVRARNSIGDSIIEPDTIIGYSGEDKPDTSPFGLKVSEFPNATSAFFTWNHVDPQSLNGHFRGYQLQTWPLEILRKRRYTRSFLHDKLIPPEWNSHLLTGFEPMSVYMIRILVVNGQYRSDPGVPIRIVMPEGIPSEVKDMQLRAVGSRTILASWKPPLTPFGRLRGYFLTFESLSTGQVEETFVTNKRRHYLYESAFPSAVYNVAIWAETGGGEGPKIQKSTTTWKVQAPTIPDFDLEIVSKISARFTWILPSFRKMPGSSFFLNYSQTDTDEWLQTEVRNLPTKTIVLNGLKPNLVYSVFMVTKDGNLSTSSKRRQFYTRNDKLGPDLSDASLSNSAWFVAIICTMAVSLVSVLIVCLCQYGQTGNYPVKKRERERGDSSGVDQLDGDEQRMFLEYQFGECHKPPIE